MNRMSEYIDKIICGDCLDVMPVVGFEVVKFECNIENGKQALSETGVRENL